MLYIDWHSDLNVGFQVGVNKYLAEVESQIVQVLTNIRLESYS